MIYPSLDEGGASRMMLAFAQILTNRGHSISIASKKGNLLKEVNKMGIHFLELSKHFKSGNLFNQIFAYGLAFTSK